VRAFLRSLVPPPVRFALRQLGLELRIARLHRKSSREVRRRQSTFPLPSVNFASGHHPKPGWINVDLFVLGADLHLDLRRPLPFADNSVGYIYAEHFFEHLEYPSVLDSTGWALEGPGTPSHALQFLRECRRVLADSGTVALVVPDAAGMIREYVEHRPTLQPGEWWGPEWCDTWMHRLNYLFRQGREHKYAYDEETLSQLLRASGFSHVTRRPFNAAMDAPNHAIGSLCMTASKHADGDGRL